MYSKGGYGTGLLPPKDWPFPVWMALMHTHDNCGPQSAEIILQMAEKAKAAYPGAEIVCGSMDDFCRELEKCDLSGLPAADKDLADTWIHGIGSYPAEISQMRENRERARRLHRGYFARLLQGGAPLPTLAPLWEQYYEAVSLFAEHTWGADVKTWLGPDRVYEKPDFLAARDTEKYRFMECSWQEQRDRAAEAARLLERNFPKTGKTSSGLTCSITCGGRISRSGSKGTSVSASPSGAELRSRQPTPPPARRRSACARRSLCPEYRRTCPWFTHNRQMARSIFFSGAIAPPPAAAAYGYRERFCARPICCTVRAEKPAGMN